MNILLDELPTKIEGIDINSDFRIMIMFELLMQDPKYNDKEKQIQSIPLFYPNLSQIKDPQKAITDMLWFYRCGIEIKNIGSNNNSKQIYSYEYDSQYIYSAFMQQYNIDLQDIDYLHWWKFKAMFENLNENTKFVEIMGYRNAKLSDFGKDKKTKEHYAKMQKIYALPDMRTKEQKEADFQNSLW